MPQARAIPTAPLIASVVTFSIKIDGEAISHQNAIKNIVVTRQVNKIPRLLLTIFDGSAATSDFEVSNESSFVPGKTIELTAGYNSQEQSLFSGVIIKQSIKVTNCESLLLIEATDVAFKMTLNPKRKIFNNLSDSDLIEQIVSDYSISFDVETSEFVHEALMQYYATDWDYIQTRAESAGMLCYCEDGQITVKKPELSREPVCELVYGASIKEFHAEIDSRFQYSAIKGLTWSSSSQELINIDAIDPVTNNQGNLAYSELSSVAQSEPYIFLHGGNLKEQELQSRIDTRLLKSRLAKIIGTVTFSGFAGVKPGNMVKLTGVGQRFSGNSFVSAVRHNVENGLWETSIQIGLSHKWFAEENDIQPIAAAAVTPSVKGLQIGVVTALENDPEGEDRIKVKIPVVDNDGDGVWCKVSVPDAGDDRGFFFRPEIGDEVVIGFFNEDPNHGVVLGGLHSAAKPAPIKASNDNNEKGIITRSKMKWIWNDDKKTLNVETPAGNKIFISDEDGQILLQDQNGNKITMNSDGITIDSAKDITLKASQSVKTNADINVETNAGSAVKINGNTSTEFSSTGTTTIKGSVVMIN